jgi:phosphonate transport system substrate-binding protein
VKAAPAAAARRRAALARLLAAAGVAAAPGAFARAPALSMGLIPFLSTRALVSVFEPLREHLQRSLARRVLSFTAVSHAAFAVELRDGGYDFAFMPAHTMRMAAQDWGYVPLARTRAPTRIVLATRADRDLRGIEDLRGGRIVLLDRLAITSMVTFDWLAANGLVPGRDVEVEHLVNISSVLLTLERADVDAVALIEATLVDFPAEQRARTRILALVRAVPSPGFAAHPRVDAELRAQLRSALLGFGGAPDGDGSIARSPFAATTLADTDELEPYAQQLRRALRER